MKIELKDKYFYNSELNRINLAIPLKFRLNFKAFNIWLLAFEFEKREGNTFAKKSIYFLFGDL